MISVHRMCQELMDSESFSPYKLQSGIVNIQLKPQCHLKAKIECAELGKAGVRIGYMNSCIEFQGNRNASYTSEEGEIEFYLPPGEYSMNTYGENVKGKVITFTVPENKTELQLDPIQMRAAPLVLLKGKPAPRIQ